MNLLTIQDFVLVTVYLGVIYAIAYRLKDAQKKKGLDSQYFIGGLTAKLFGVTAFCVIYGLYYGNGDTVSYYTGALSLSNMMSYDWDVFSAIFFENDLSEGMYAEFNVYTEVPPHYMFKDNGTFSVVRFSTVLCLLSFKSFFVTSLLTATLSYIGAWKLYRLFTLHYTEAKRAIAICILFMPSLIFWGSGIMKDSYVLGATCWFTYNFYYVFIARKKVLPNAILMLFNLFIIASMKPYIILSLLPGALLWLNNAYLKQVSSKLIKSFLLPILGVIVLAAGFVLYRNLGSLMGDYGNIEQTVEKAKLIQKDLLRQEQYGSNNYNLGEIDGSVTGMATMAPMAIFTALYRPLFFEIGSPMMVVSALENSLLLGLTVLLIIKIRFRNLIRILIGEPLILYSIFFSLLLAFGVGIASTNFGALSRYKIPFMPFYFTAIYLIYILNTRKEERII